MAQDDKLALASIRSTLIRQEDTIIFALIERAQFKINDVCYSTKAPQFAQLTAKHSSFLDTMLLETERLHARVRRYTGPDEHAFFPDKLPPPELPLIDFPPTLHPCAVNLNAQIKDLYIHKVMPAICEPGDDGQHGSTAVADISVLQAISKRVHYGMFVAESKMRSQFDEFSRLIRAGDQQAIMDLLTYKAVEERVLRRVRRKACTFGRDVEADDNPAADDSPMKVDPEAIVRLYADFIIPLTKEAELQYLLQRLGNTSVAFEADPARALSELAEQHVGAAALKYKAEAAPLLRCKSAADVIEAVMSNRAFVGMVLLEQGDSGVVPSTRALLLDTPLKVVGELHHKSRLTLLAQVPLDRVRSVRGSRGALRRCEAWIRQRAASSVEFVEAEAGALWEGVDKDSGSSGSAASSSPGVAILVDTRSDVPEAANFAYRVEVSPQLATRTRCVLLSKRDALPPATGNDKSMAIVALPDEPGKLAAALAIFTKYQVNLTYLQSAAIAASGEPQAAFFVELQGHAHDENVRAAFGELDAIASSVKLLGSYVCRGTGHFDVRGSAWPPSTAPA